MTTAPPVLPELPDPVALPERGTGERHRRRHARRRLAREQLVMVALLIVALVITVVILGQQWLDSGATGTTTGASISTLVGGST
jgi:ferric-dicitrate binding protein FerR (iron transport regulator)